MTELLVGAAFADIQTYIKLIEEAKTQTKKRFYQKKIKALSTKLSHALID